MKKIKTYKTLFIVNFFILAMVVFYGIQIGGKGAELAAMEEELADLIMAKQQLQEQVLLAGSSEQMEQKALELGYIKPLTVVYVDSQAALTSNIVQ